jgi:hypothetical protein
MITQFPTIGKKKPHLKTKPHNFGIIGQDIMIYYRQFIVLLFSLASFSQLSPTIAFSQRACINMILGFDPVESVDYSVLETLILDQCDGKNDCDVNLTSWSTNGLGGENFKRMCSEVNRTTFDRYPILMKNDCPSFKVSYEGLHLCLPADCDCYEHRHAAFDEMMKKAGFDTCSDFAASNTPVPTAVVVSIVVILILICVGVGTFFVCRHVKSLPTYRGMCEESCNPRLLLRLSSHGTGKC